MKKLFFFAALALTLSTFVACGDPANEPDDPNKEGKEDPKDDPKDDDKATITFTVSNITKMEATAKAVCSDSKLFVQTEIVAKSFADQFGGIEEYIKDTLAKYDKIYEQYGGLLAQNYGIPDYAAFLQNDLKAVNCKCPNMQKGSKTITDNRLLADTKYIAYAYIMDMTTFQYSGLVTKEFTTEKLVPSKNEIEIQFENGVVTFTPSNSDPYFATYVKTSDLERWMLKNGTKKIEDYVVNRIAQQFEDGYLSFYYHTATYSEDYVKRQIMPKTPNGTAYTLFAVGYEGGLTTDIFSMDVVY